MQAPTPDYARKIHSSLRSIFEMASHELAYGVNGIDQRLSCYRIVILWDFQIHKFMSTPEAQKQNK
jgi:hypothetical protein